jgi:hypothetical protein
VTDVHVGGGRVDPELDDEPFATGRRQPAGQAFGGRQEFLRPGRDQRGLLGRGQIIVASSSRSSPANIDIWHQRVPSVIQPLSGRASPLPTA